MTKQTKFLQNLLHDIKKQTILAHLQNSKTKINFLPRYKYLVNLGYEIENSNELKELTQKLIEQDGTGQYKDYYIASFQNTIFFLKENNNELSDYHFAYLNIEKSNVIIHECLGNDLICETEKGVKFRLEVINQNEYEKIESKNFSVLVSCFADNANIKPLELYEINKEKTAVDEMYISNGSNAKILSGIISSYKKILNSYSNKMFNEIHIKCLGLDIAVILPEEFLDESKIKKGNILKCSGLLTGLLYEQQPDIIDRSIILNGKARLKKYLICINKNKNALCCVNINKNGNRNDKHTYIYPTADIKNIAFKKVYNGIFNAKIKINLKNSKSFSCYIENSWKECIELFDKLEDVDLNI